MMNPNNEYKNLIDQLKAIYKEESKSERDLFYKIAEYAHALLNYSYSVSTNINENGKEVLEVRESGNKVGHLLLEEIEASDKSENIELEATYSKALSDLVRLVQKLEDILEKINDKPLQSRLQEVKNILSDKVPIRENKAILVHRKLTELILLVSKQYVAINLNKVASISRNEDVEFVNVVNYEKFIARYDHWILRREVSVWEAWQTMAQIYIVIDNDVENKERLKMIRADSLIIEDNDKFSEEVKSVIGNNKSGKRELLPNIEKIQKQFSLFHRYVIAELGNQANRKEKGLSPTTEPAILKCGKLQLIESKCELAWDTIWYSDIPVHKKSVKMLITLLKVPEETIEYKKLLDQSNIISPYKGSDSETAQQYKNQLQKDLVLANIPENVSNEIKNMIKPIPKKGYRISSK